MTARTDQLDDIPAGYEEKHHPPDTEYVLIAAILAVLTAIEVGLYYMKLEFVILAGALGTLMIVKFSLVVMFFMHLRYDSKVFRRVFVTGVLLAVGVYICVLMMFHVFLR